MLPRTPAPAILALALLVPAIAGGALAWRVTGGGDATAVVAPHDTVRLHVALFDTSGRLLFSTRVADEPTLRAVAADWSGPFFVPELAQDSPMRAELGDGFAPSLVSSNITLPIGSSLFGHGVGHKVVLPVLGRYEGYANDVVLERVRGPFNVTLATRASTLANATTSADGERIVLEGVLPARVVSRDGDAARVRLDLEDGARLPIANTTLVARVALHLGGERLSLVLDAKPGDAFSLSTACAAARTVLAPGSYVVASVDEHEIRLKHSTTRAPQLMQRELVAGLEIVSIGE